MDPAIIVEQVHYEYPGAEEQPAQIALTDVSFSVQPGEFVAVVGHNGSGKSTLAKLLNGILTPQAGRILIKGLDTADQSHIWDIRRSAGMVFQNPDNQLVTTIVEEDVAFGPENLGIPPPEIRQRVTDALTAVGMTKFATASPHKLSGGQKQRIAIAGILAMKPDIILLDEPTAMLDPVGREEVMHTILKLNREEGKTILHITHFMEEAVLADRLFVMEEGRIIMQGPPREVFIEVDKLHEVDLRAPSMTELAQLLIKRGLPVRRDVVSVPEMVEELCRLS